MRSEGSQPVYNSFRNAIVEDLIDRKVNRVMQELGNIRGLETDEVKNYILIPCRTKDKDGKEHTTSWHIHEIHKDCNVRYKYNEDVDEWSKPSFNF